jgi:hypothetical protein
MGFLLYGVIMRQTLAIIIGLASPLVATEVVKAVLYVLSKLEDTAAQVNTHDATIVQTAIDLTSSHATWVGIALAGYAVYATRSRRSKAMKQFMSAAAESAALVAPASLYLLR